MLERAFSFQGRLARLPYFLGALALGAAYAVGLGAILVGGMAAVAGRDWSAVGLLLVALLPLAVATLWCGLSLYVRRIRDIGWDPTFVIAGWLFAKVADKLVIAALVPKLALHDIWHGTYLGLALDAGLSLAILFWPSSDPVDDDRHLQPGPPRWPEAAHPTRPRPPRRAPCATAPPCSAGASERIAKPMSPLAATGPRRKPRAPTLAPSGGPARRLWLDLVAPNAAMGKTSRVRRTPRLVPAREWPSFWRDGPAPPPAAMIRGGTWACSIR